LWSIILITGIIGYRFHYLLRPSSVKLQQQDIAAPHSSQQFLHNFFRKCIQPERFYSSPQLFCIWYTALMKKIIPIITLCADFAGVLRVLKYRVGHLENDAEHSYQLAMVCWSANHQYDLGLQDEKLLKYALVHDLVELYSGDTDAFGDEERLAQKTENEERSFQRLRQNYAPFNELLAAIETYREKQEPEAKLVNIFDKLIAETNILNSNDDYYIRRKVDLQKWKERLFSKIDYETLPDNMKRIVDEAVRETETVNKDIFFNRK
jgi:5'-deoxynucleotidase YfbR-like HD superfamily hydrolase